MIPIPTPHEFKQVDGFAVPVMPAIRLDREYWAELLPQITKTQVRELAKTLDVPGRSKAGIAELTGIIAEILPGAPVELQGLFNGFYRGYLERPGGNLFSYKSTVKDEFGITDRWVDLLPVWKKVDNPHYSSASPSLLYYRPLAQAMVEANPERLAELQARREARKRGKDWSPVFGKRYGTVDASLPDVAAAMFNLNRYTKHRTCTRPNRDEIYSLKNRLIEALYKAGLARNVYLHRLKLEAKVCFSCGGSGDWLDWDTDEFEKCWKCRGTGEYLPAKTLEFVVFSFDVQGVTYTWHQPKELIRFAVEYTQEAEAMVDLPADKPIEVSRQKLSELKALVRWFLENQKQENLC